MDLKYIYQGIHDSPTEGIFFFFKIQSSKDT